MSTAKQISDTIRYAPTVRYTVSAQDVYGEWHKWPSNKEPRRFVNEELARRIKDGIENGEDVLQTLLCKEETVYFSDIETRNVNSLTVFTALLV